MIHTKSTFLIFLIQVFATFLVAQTSLTGAWQQQDDKGITRILLFSGNYFSWTEHETATGAFHFTKGGSWKMNKNKVGLTYEFNTSDTAMVGKTETVKIRLKKGRLSTQSQNGSVTWENIDGGAPTPLTGSWLMAGRERDGEVSRRSTDGPRKTMKVLTGTRFQWIAYNTATKQFFGTGGGTYTAENGAYTENIQFFSRNIDRVGVSLAFQFRIQDGEWRHIGNSSAGEPMHEIWSRRE